MIVIDGAAGEGGGQVLRAALSLALVTGQPFRIENIRANRRRSGLMRQHMTAVEAACAISHARCEGLEIGASVLEFVPGRVVAGDYQFAVGTAGSTGLVLQTILPPLLLTEGPSHLVLEGGTHNPQAPPFDFVTESFLPVINRMGPHVVARLDRHGFYPAGGGRIVVDVNPAKRLNVIEVMERGASRHVTARALITGLTHDIAQRELQAVAQGLSWPQDALKLEALPDDVGPGNVLLLEAAFEHVTEIVAGFGQLGVSADAVGHRTVRRMAGYLGSQAAVGPFLADQLLLPMALAGGGRFSTVKPSQHTRTAADVIVMFLDVQITFTERGGVHIVTVSKA